MKKLFVGNISWQATQEQLADLFAQYGNVEEAIIITDRTSGRSKGFGFVTFTNDDEAEKAIEALNGYDFEGRNLVVNVARPREDRPQRNNRY